MPRSHGKGRGTRLQKGAFSGTTFVTVPSGVTIDKNGADYGGGSQLLWNGGYSTWAGSSLTLTHGFTTLTAIQGSHISTAASPGYVVFKDNGISGAVSAAVFTDVASATSLLSATGGTVTWMACGQ